MNEEAHTIVQIEISSAVLAYIAAVFDVVATYLNALVVFSH